MSVALKLTFSVPASVPPPTSPPCTEVTDGLLASRKVMSAPYRYSEADGGPPVAGHVPPGAPPQLALPSNPVTPVSGPELIMLLVARGELIVPTELQP